MNNIQETSLEESSVQIEEYLQSSGNQQYIMTFDDIITHFIIDEAPSRARIYCSFYVAKLAFNLLINVASLFEQLFPKLDFKKYLELCIENDCIPRRIYNSAYEGYPETDHAVLKLLTDTICYALVIYLPDTDEELGFEYLSEARALFTELNKVNISQRNKAKQSRADALSKLILEIVKSNPNIHISELLKELKEDDRIDVDEDKNEISFEHTNGQFKIASFSGLPDRLKRAKEKLAQGN